MDQIYEVSDFKGTDDDKIRKVELDNNTIVMQRLDPYGLIHISLLKGGKLPENLKGTFTTFEEAMKQIRLYVSNRQDKKN